MLLHIFVPLFASAWEETGPAPWAFNALDGQNDEELWSRLDPFQKTQLDIGSADLQWTILFQNTYTIF